jgi:two-component system, response regulator YesN
VAVSQVSCDIIGIIMNTKLYLLIVDDEPTIRNGLANTIDWDSLGLEVIGTAADGNEALTMIHNLSPHIVITDIRMPNCDGLELIRIAREENLPCHFIILSGYEDFKYAQTAIRYHVSSYLLKPIQIEELSREIISLRDTSLKELQQNQSNILTQQQLLEQNSTLKHHFGSRLLENEYKTDAEIEKQISFLNLTLTNSSVCVVIFVCSLSEDNGKENHTVPVINHAQEIISKVFKDCHYLLVAKDATSIALILNTESLKDNASNTLPVLCEQTIKLLNNRNDAPFNIGIGDTVSSLIFVPTSYLSALEAVSYRIYQTQQSVFDSSIISHAPTPVITPDNKMNQELVDAIYLSDTEGIHKLLHEFFHSLFYVEVPPPNYIRGMSIFLIIDIQTSLSAIHEGINTLFVDIPYVEINKLESFREIRKWVTHKCLSYALYFKENISYTKDPVIQKAKAYIKENIYNKIKAESVAAHVGLSENYFTVYFKEKTGENFKNYVQKMKMDIAKDYLKTSAILIGELSAMLGYEDYRSFNRAFKKETDLTPSEYSQKYH